MKPTILNERYRLGELIGVGGMATVYRGSDLLLQRDVAIKFLREPYSGDPAFRERFLEEARAAAKLEHPNVVHIYDVGADEQDRPYIVMELVEGEDLKALIRASAPLSVPQAIDLVEQICDGVGHAHRAGLVHCDLKPQNILVTPEGQVKVADFGIARAFAVEQDVEEEREQVVWGSPHYISPEQVSGESPTPASDVYSIGIILYELLTGVPPFHDPDPAILAVKHLREDPPSPSTINPRVPGGLEWIVRKVLSKDPSARYRNADQFKMALEEYRRQGEEMTIPQTVAPSEPQDPTVTPPPPSRVSVKSSPSASSSSSKEVDWTLWILFAVASLLVLGLIPLWTIVYRMYNTPLPTHGLLIDTNTPTVAPETRMVSVPNLVGLSFNDARQLAVENHLLLEKLGEQESDTARPGAVLEQTPGSGSRVAISTTISVIVATGRAFVLPDVTGYDLDVVQEGLESEGALLHIEKVWSTEREGIVLKQEPEAGTELRAGDSVTLTVSGGTNQPIPLHVNLNDQVILEDARISRLTFRPGDSVPVTLRWHCLKPFDHSYKVFVHLLTSDLHLVTQQDIEPLNGLHPTNQWQAGEIINDPHQVILPSNTPAGTYQIRVGLYDDQGRLPVKDAGDAQVLDNTILITTITVQP